MFDFGYFFRIILPEKFRKAQDQASASTAKAKEGAEAVKTGAIKQAKAVEQLANDIKETDTDSLKTQLRNWKRTTWILVGIALFIGPLYVIPTGGGGPALAYEALTLTSMLSGFLVGVISALLIFFAWWLLKNFGAMALGLLILFSPLILFVSGDLLFRDSLQSLTAYLGGGLGFLVGAGLVMWALISVTLPITYEEETKLPIPSGTSRWANIDDLEQAKLLGDRDGEEGLFLGFERETEQAIVYNGDMHGLTVAPTRTGKGAAAIIPNLKRSNSSMLVIDPKGENARRTISDRMELGNDVYIVDPWNISFEADKYGPGVEELSAFVGYNPLASLDPNDPDLASDVMILAESIVIDESKDPFWSNEAKALLQGFIMHVITSEDEDEKHLGRVRDILCLPMQPHPDTPSERTLEQILKQMDVSEYPVVRQAAARFRQKSAKERSGVLSTAQSNTHFLDSPKIRDSLSLTTFSFKELKTDEKPITVYLVLPLDRLQTFNRWLRLLISAAMIDLTRVPQQPGKPPVRIILDEFAALQKLDLIETAYGTMAGMGVQLWIFTQDLGQLMRLYGDKAWQTFVSNAGIFQYFGSRDYETAKYAEHLCGMTTMRKASWSFGKNWGTSSSTTSSSSGTSYTSGRSGGRSETTSYDDVSRPLAYADEMMTLHRDLQLLFVENNYPIIARKDYYFNRPEEQREAIIEDEPPMIPDFSNVDINYSLGQSRP